ncbi:MAG: cation transporter [Bacteroidales bacterium]|nr:cation transporter [Bacteroidales bacterium]MCF8338345.1 cation transporter [Bacteroidales bacterium]
MNNKAFFSVVIFLFAGMMAFAGGDKEEFKVYGNCGMCESRVEKAANDLEGVTSADWDKETKMMEVAYNDSEVEVKEIHKAIAEAGHDTEKVTAEDKTYGNLPGCCQYDRKDSEE